jgi:hypothetical protein
MRFGIAIKAHLAVSSLQLLDDSIGREEIEVSVYSPQADFWQSLADHFV